MLQLVRTYYNSTDDILRQDTIFLIRTRTPLTHGVEPFTYRRSLNSQYFHGPANRQVSSIECSGTYDAIEQSSSNYLWASWSVPDTTLYMSDLPQINDTI
jgi:hypothetical protein